MAKHVTMSLGTGEVWVSWERERESIGDLPRMTMEEKTTRVLSRQAAKCGPGGRPIVHTVWLITVCVVVATNGRLKVGDGEAGRGRSRARRR